MPKLGVPELDRNSYSTLGGWGESQAHYVMHPPMATARITQLLAMNYSLWPGPPVNHQSRIYRCDRACDVPSLPALVVTALLAPLISPLSSAPTSSSSHIPSTVTVCLRSSDLCTTCSMFSNHCSLDMTFFFDIFQVTQLFSAELQCLNSCIWHGK